MKRKHTLLEDSEQSDINDDGLVETKLRPQVKTARHRRRRSSRCLKVAFFSVTIVSVVFLAVFIQNYEDFASKFDQIVGERCRSDYWAPRNLTKLKILLEENVFGQHVAQSLILSTLSRRWSFDSPKLEKPLVMSFHGWTGSGKNYVAKFVADSLFRRGLTSRHVRIFVSTVHFYDPDSVDAYKRQLHEWIRSNVTQCPETLFIFDEVDKMPAGLLDGLKPFMDFHATIDGLDMSKSMFILLSNTGGRLVTKRTLEFWQAGHRRADIRYADLEQLIETGAFNEDGGLHRSDIIDKSLIDVYVPFLPLETVHVRQCVERELSLRDVHLEKRTEFVNKVLGELSFWPAEHKIFATSGCKRVAQKVDHLLYEEGH